MVTLRDVALAAGVHTTTASSILNGSVGNSRSSEETKQKVISAAKKLGYSQNRLASSLRTRRTSTVGLVAGNIQNPFFAELSLQLEQHLRAQGYELVLTCHGADSVQNEGSLAQTLLARSVDGLLIWSELREGRTPRLPAKSPTPRLWLGYGPRNEAAVSIDIAEGLELALRHLSTLGCRRIGYYAPAYSEHSGLPKSRPELLDETCRKLNLPPPLRLLFPGESWNLDAAVRCAAPLMTTARESRVDGIIAYNDVSAVGWKLAADSARLKVPVVGFDGSPLIRALYPKISYVDLHSDLLAQNAVSMLCGFMKGEKPPTKHTLVRPTFVAATED